MLSPKLRYCLSVAVLALAAMVIAAVVTDGPTFLSAQTAEPSVMEQTDAAAATEVEIQQRFNELRGELLDDRSDTVEWWLTATAIFVTLFGVGAVLLGYISFNRLREIAEEAKGHLQAIEKGPRAVPTRSYKISGKQPVKISGIPRKLRKLARLCKTSDVILLLPR